MHLLINKLLPSFIGVFILNVDESVSATFELCDHCDLRGQKKHVLSTLDLCDVRKILLLSSTCYYY